MRWSDDQLAAMRRTATRAAHELLHTVECIEERDMPEAENAARMAAEDVAEVLGDFELGEGFWREEGKR